MNIRSVTNPIIPADQTTATKEARTVKTDESSQDRDADGRRQEKEQDQSPLNEEEFQHAKEYLENIETIKTSRLQFSVETSGDLRIFVIKDQQGVVVRRIPEHEMRFLTRDKDKPTGKLLDRAS